MIVKTIMMDNNITVAVTSIIHAFAIILGIV
jgi:hypothetical protein